MKRWSIYSIQSYTKYVLALLALLIGGVSLYMTRALVLGMELEEQAKMELWAGATRELIAAQEGCDLSFVQQVITANTTIPVILVDEDYHPLSYRNLPLDEMPTEKVTALAHTYAAENDPIVVHIDDNTIQYICYGDSVLLQQLSYYPLMQMGMAVVFLLLVVAVLLAFKRAEQNKVWVGLSKETAHQLGTPISSLLAWVEMLESKYPADDMLPEMSRDVNRLRTIAERFSQIGSKAELEVVDMDDVLHRATDYMRTRISKKVSLSYEGISNRYVMMNVPLFEWVVENLCKNAVDAMDGEGSLCICMQETEKWICADFTDTGKGVSKKDMYRVFRPGFTTKKRGWGLGLSLARRIIEDYHKGKIFIKHSEPRKGTTFRIELRKI